MVMVVGSGASQAGAAGPVTQRVSADQYTNPSSQHRTQVEPDSFAWGSTIVAAVQTGRFYDGGSSNIDVTTSSDGGRTWTSTGLPGITVNGEVPGPNDRVSDPSVAYDAKHDVWLVSTLPIVGGNSGVLTSRSVDGGHTWGRPVVVVDPVTEQADKNWIVCDNSASSPYFGNCYTEWDGGGNELYMNTSTDGGLTWGPPRPTADRAIGIGGQPLVQPNGTVIVPAADAFESSVIAFRSTNGGSSWGAAVTITGIASHRTAGDLRTGPLPSAEIDAAGRVYVAWQDCRFRVGCRSNDIVFVTSDDGVAWSPVRRIPLDPVGSTADHVIPGLAVDRATAGATARLALAYYFVPRTSCVTCRLSVGFATSTDGGAHWSAPRTLAGPMRMSWLPSTTQGVMVGDYISTSFVAGQPVPLFTVAKAARGTALDQALTATVGLTVAGGSAPADALARSHTGVGAGAGAGAGAGGARRVVGVRSR